MDIYLAGRYSRREELLGYADELRAAGHTVQARWLAGSHQYSGRVAEGDADTYNDGSDPLDHVAEAARLFATEDVEDIMDADTVISFTEVPRKPSTNRGGRHVEFGLAYAWAKLIIVVGPRENAFHFLDGVAHYATWAECLSDLRDAPEAI